MTEGAIYPELLESFVRDELNRTATRCVPVCMYACMCLCIVLFILLLNSPRVMAVLYPQLLPT